MPMVENKEKGKILSKYKNKAKGNVISKYKNKEKGKAEGSRQF